MINPQKINSHRTHQSKIAASFLGVAHEVPLNIGSEWTVSYPFNEPLIFTFKKKLRSNPNRQERKCKKIFGRNGYNGVRHEKKRDLLSRQTRLRQVGPRKDCTSKAETPILHFFPFSPPIETLVSSTIHGWHSGRVTCPNYSPSQLARSLTRRQAKRVHQSGNDSAEQHHDDQFPDALDD